jgi:hypothetical protein
MRRITNQRVEKYPLLCPVLRQWRGLVERYCKNEKKDAPYWYTERSNVGILAAAAWQSKRCVSLEEYSVDKSRPLGRGKQRWSGRADLWIRVEKKEYVFEAKHRFWDIGSKARRSIDYFPEYSQKRLNKAKQEAKRIDRKSGRALAILFIAPSIPIIEKKKINERINIFLKKLKEVNADVAWVFPSNAPDIRWERRIYPGVVMLIN